MRRTKLRTPSEAYIFEYQMFDDLGKQQFDLHWPPDEINVAKDIQDMRVHMAEAEYHGVVTTLRLFTQYELFLGTEFWGGRVMRMFPRKETQKMANCFSFFELNIHAPFYAKINEALNLNTEEFYLSYTEDPVLKDRIDFINSLVASKDDLYSVAMFSLVEGAVLYSSFAFLKHFQSDGKNKILNIVRGINFSLRDETIHSMGAAMLYRQEVEELGLSDDKLEELQNKIIEGVKQVREHEFRIIEMIFEKGKIEGITEVQMKNFVDSRINVCLQQLDIKPVYEVTYNPIAKWFYRGTNAVQFNDFFTGAGNEYNRNWDEQKFAWPTLEESE